MSQGLAGFSSGLFRNDIAGLTNPNPINNAGYVTQDVLNDTGYWNPSNNSGSSWFGQHGILPTAFMGLQTLGGLANAYTGLQALDLSRRQFGFAKDSFNAQLGNSIKNYENAAANARRVAYALQGDYAPSVFGTKSQKEAGDQYAKEVTNGMVRRV